MNIQNLNSEELMQLQSLLNKMNPKPTEKVYLDPTNKMIDNIILEFDFIKVQSAMEALNWKWLAGVPTIEDLRNEAHRLLRGAANSRLYMFKDEHWEQGIQNSTGGFEAIAWCDENKTKIIRLELKFVLTSWDDEIEN
jgi:hypothetical protein